MDNVIVVSDDDKDEAKDVVNGDSNSDNLYIGHQTKSLIFSGVHDLFQCAYNSINTQVPARELCGSVSADAAIFCYYGAT